MPKNIIFIVILYLSTYGLGLAQSESLREESANPLVYAVAWKQTAAEYRALFHQGFNVATTQSYFLPLTGVIWLPRGKIFLMTMLGIPGFGITPL